MERPPFEDIRTGAEFNRWYWLKEELVAICKQANIPGNGRKFELRDRIIFALDHPNEPLPKAPKKVKKSTFNWARASLSLDTKITDSVSFGPNFRNFMKSHVGKRFSCHSDFMDWVKANTGKTLEDAVMIWHELEDRKKNPDFKRAIAANNMLAQYVRDFLADNPEKRFKDALHHWKIKKTLPTETGFVVYEISDLELVGET
ncbi:DUF6434 domain-containing protein [Maribacter sp. 2-571]|uniref:DUF6434 domain-containing protein n=1 Tax=Maribacter sp. 2-571 TaxID=3417569 RepID=UPI003D356510